MVLSSTCSPFWIHLLSKSLHRIWSLTIFKQNALKFIVWMPSYGLCLLFETYTYIASQAIQSNHPHQVWVSVDVDVVIDELYQKQCVFLCSNQTICWTMFSNYLVCFCVCVEMYLLSFPRFLLSFAPASVMGVCTRKLRYQCSIRYAPTSTLNIILCKFVIVRLDHTHTYTLFCSSQCIYTWK